MRKPDINRKRLPLDEDPLFRAPALGRSRDGLTSTDHDAVLYGDGPSTTRPAHSPEDLS